MNAKTAWIYSCTELNTDANFHQKMKEYEDKRLQAKLHWDSLHTEIELHV